jgi:hypothetical protein
MLEIKEEEKNTKIRSLSLDGENEIVSEDVGRRIMVVITLIYSFHLILPPCLAVAFLTVKILEVNLDATVTPSS